MLAARLSCPTIIRVKIRHRTAAVRRQVKRLAAIAEKRAAEGTRPAHNFRPLTEAEISLGEASS